MYVNIISADELTICIMFTSRRERNVRASPRQGGTGAGDQAQTSPVDPGRYRVGAAGTTYLHLVRAVQLLAHVWPHHCLQEISDLSAAVLSGQPVHERLGGI